MEKWEYLIIDEAEITNQGEEKGTSSDRLTSGLNRLGKDGWELITIKCVFPSSIYYFKRKIVLKLAPRVPSFKEKTPGDLLKGDNWPYPVDIPLEDHFVNTLIDAEIITPEQLQQTQEIQKAKNLPIEKVLTELGFISEDEANELLVLYFGAPLIKLSEYILERESLNLIPKEICEKSQLIPVSLEKNTLTIAMANPRDIETINLLRLLNKDKEIRIVYSAWDDIQRAIKMYHEGRYYGGLTKT